jgi:1-acyl-sn-glycerol-3-phosphate acyltransferase
MRLYLRCAAIAAGLIVCLPLHYLSRRLFGRSYWARRFLLYAGRRCGLVVRVEGQPLDGRVLFAANHVSWLDILGVGGAARTAFVAKDDVARWPAIGWMADLNDTIYVARAARAAARNQADNLRAALDAGRAVAFFPEGTTEGGAEVLPFRASLFASLYPPIPGVRVQPVAIDYGALTREIAWVGDESTGANAKRLLRRAGRIPVTIRFLAPIDAAETGDRKTLAARARAEIVAALDRGASGDRGDRL